MAKRYFTMLAHVFKPKKHQAAGALISEKLEGMRAIWDGGVSRGVRKWDVPYANIDKDERFLVDQVATGLWSRLGNVIHAPDWWLDQLPKTPLDGEMWIGRGQWQRMMSIVKDLEPGPGWREVGYYCFDMPSPDTMLADGMVEFRHKQTRLFLGTLEWYKERAKLDYWPKGTTPFRSTYTLLQRHLEGCEIAFAHRQSFLPYGHFALDVVDELVADIVGEGGEGCILRDPDSTWKQNRCHTLVKCKIYLDDEATVIGYTTGRQTDRGSRLQGMMGALILNYKGKRLEISGFTDKERQFNSADARAWAVENPGQDAPEWIEAKMFPRGKEITFKYRSLSDDKIPQEAQFLRRDK